MQEEEGVAKLRREGGGDGGGGTKRGGGRGLGGVEGRRVQDKDEEEWKGEG